MRHLPEDRRARKIGRYVEAQLAEAEYAIALVASPGGYAANGRIKQPDHGLDVLHGFGEALGLFPVL